MPGGGARAQRDGHAQAVSFGILALVAAAGLMGPLLGAWGRGLVPVVVGELAAGVVIGRTGFGWIDADQPTLAFLAEVGFAMLMFAAGMNVPLRDTRLLGALRRGSVAALLVAIGAAAAGIGLAELSGTGHAAIYSLLLATGSAAVVLPVLQEAGISGPDALVVMAQVTVADVATIVALPIVLQPDRAWRAALGGLVVTAVALAILGLARLTRRRPWVVRLRRLSKRRDWALDLRACLVSLFVLAYLATRIGTSVLIAGFAAGLIVAWVGGPKRLSRQVTGVGAGFLVPLFFVVLGARLDLRALGEEPSRLVVAGGLLAASLIVHLVVARVTRQSLPAGLVATAQLGVPAAVAALGLSLGVIDPGLAGAIVAAALGSLAACSVGAALMARTSSPATGEVAIPAAPP